MNQCVRLFSLVVLAGGLIGSAAAQPNEREGGFDGDNGRDFAPGRGAREERFGEQGGRFSEQGGRFGEQGGRFGEQGGRFGRGPQTSPMFTAIDTDGDGVITNRELRKAATALKKLDADGDGNITLEEASPPPGSGRGGPGGPGGPEDPNAMINRMMENDANGDGVLSANEVPAQVRRMLSGADLNNDGVIDREELSQAVQNMQNRFGGRGGRRGSDQGGAGAGSGGNAEQTLQRLMASDANGDGLLSTKEVPQAMMPMLRGADLNGDGYLNSNEVQQAVAKMRNRGGNRGRGGPPER